MGLHRQIGGASRHRRNALPHQEKSQQNDERHFCEFQSHDNIGSLRIRLPYKDCQSLWLREMNSSRVFQHDPIPRRKTESLESFTLVDCGYLGLSSFFRTQQNAS